jgi:hypothetical protein
MRIVPTTAYLPPPNTRSPHRRRRGDFTANAQTLFDADGDETILSATGLSLTGTFLTQYLAREIMPRGAVPASRWSYRDTVYRLGAQLSDAAAGELALDA